MQKDNPISHRPTHLGNFISLYIKAHYFRPDGEDREFEQYGNTPENQDLIEGAFRTKIYVKSFSFNYHPDRDELALRTTATFIDISKAQKKTLESMLDLSCGECSPEIAWVPNGDYLSVIVTENY